MCPVCFHTTVKVITFSLFVLGILLLIEALHRYTLLLILSFYTSAQLLETLKAKCLAKRSAVLLPCPQVWLIFVLKQTYIAKKESVFDLCKLLTRVAQPGDGVPHILFVATFKWRTLMFCPFALFRLLPWVRCPVSFDGAQQARLHFSFSSEPSNLLI